MLTVQSFFALDPFLNFLLIATHKKFESEPSLLCWSVSVLSCCSLSSPLFLQNILDIMISQSLLLLLLLLNIPSCTQSFRFPLESTLLRPFSVASSFMVSLDSHEMEKPPTETTTTTTNVSLPIRRRRHSKKEPLIAVIGRPNVGKSALVNRIAGTHSGGAIVADVSGITRDRTYRPAHFLGESFQIVDTGGLVFDDDETTLFAKEIRQQAMVAIEESSAVIMVVDGKMGMTPMDQTIGDFLRTEVLKDIPIHVAVNKCESEQMGSLQAVEFWKLGLGEPLPVSALHGVGTAELLETVFASIAERKSAIEGFGTKVRKLQAAKDAFDSEEPLPGEDETDAYLRKKYGVGSGAERVIEQYEAAMAAFDQEETPEEINIAIVGRPNVGKSSLTNAIFGETRSIVSEIAGTTRDSIDAVMERPSGIEGKPSTIYRFVDTAGIRRKGKVDFGPEFFMVNRALRAIRRSDVGRY